MTSETLQAAQRLTCCGRVTPPGSWRAYACGVTAKYEHQGKAYCKKHHPPNLKAKSDARIARYGAELAEQQSARDAAQIAADAQRKDAEIYRWLRKQHAWWLLNHFPAQRPYVEAADVLDEAIAVAMAAKEIK